MSSSHPLSRLPLSSPASPGLLELSNSQHCPHPSTIAPPVFPIWIHNPLAACGRARILGSLHTSPLHPRTHVSCCFYWVSSCPQVRPPHLSRALFQELFHWSLATSLATPAALRPRKPQGVSKTGHWPTRPSTLGGGGGCHLLSLTSHPPRAMQFLQTHQVVSHLLGLAHASPSASSDSLLPGNLLSTLQTSLPFSPGKASQTWPQRPSSVLCTHRPGH